MPSFRGEAGFFNVLCIGKIEICKDVKVGKCKDSAFNSKISLNQLQPPWLKWWFFWHSKSICFCLRNFEVNHSQESLILYFCVTFDQAAENYDSKRFANHTIPNGIAWVRFAPAAGVFFAQLKALLTIATMTIWPNWDHYGRWFAG